MIMFFCIWDLRDYPSLKFSLLLIIFSFDWFFSYYSRYNNCCHCFSSSIAFTGSTFTRFNGYNLKVCYNLYTMLLISNVFLGWGAKGEVL